MNLHPLRRFFQQVVEQREIFPETFRGPVVAEQDLFEQVYAECVRAADDLLGKPAVHLNALTHGSSGHEIVPCIFAGVHQQIHTAVRAVRFLLHRGAVDRADERKCGHDGFRAQKRREPVCQEAVQRRVKSVCVRIVDLPPSAAETADGLPQLRFPAVLQQSLALSLPV